MFYTVRIMNRVFDTDPFTEVVIVTNIFSFLWSLEHSSEVTAFQVSKEGKIITNQDLRKGPLSKWVTEFTKEHYQWYHDFLAADCRRIT